ncbi:MAG: HAMP domain-containing sensor histidine kinase [Acutalibacteraceae bacterium]|nr:HAMP domain-containing sensor histidine kinase [Acutalibacteraceae bacterium]
MLKTHSKSAHNKFLLTLAFSIVSFVITISSVGAVFYFFRFVNRSPMLDIERLPPHIEQLVIGLISLTFGFFASMFFKRFLLNPLYEIYGVLDEIAGGNYKVKITPKGIRTIRTVSKRINNMANELDSVEIMRNDFISNFSHEFKTPIVSVEGFAKMLKEKSLSEAEREEYLDIIISESHRLAELSNNILNLNKLENQKIASGKTKFNVSEQIRLVVATLYHKCTEKDIKVEFNGDDYNIFANEHLLQQLWINLTDNAVKYSEKGGSVEIYASKKGENLIFRFVDHGIGMTENDLQHAFDKFYQGDLNHKSVGNGIGLPVAKKICELHDGEIRILQTENGGVTIEVTLPCLV